MTSRIGNMPVYASRSDQVSANLYNLWRRVRMRSPMPIRLELPELKSMSLIIEQDHWLLIDPKQFDLPIIAWLNFQDQGRSSLHTDVPCQLNYYHYMATRFRSQTLELLEQRLQQRLQPTLELQKHQKDRH